jgi:hypothetical protein
MLYNLFWDNIESFKELLDLIAKRRYTLTRIDMVGPCMDPDNKNSMQEYLAKEKDVSDPMDQSGLEKHAKKLGITLKFWDYDAWKEEKGPKEERW